MNNKMKIICICAIAVILMLAVVSAGDTTQQATTADPTVQITDIVGRTVEIPANVTRVAALTGYDYERLMILNQTDKISIMYPLSSSLPWALEVAPQLKDIPTIASMQDPNIEDLLNKNVQVVISLYFKGAIEKMTAVGIPAVVTQFAASSGNSGMPQTEEEFADRVKNEMKLYGEVMGPEAEENAEEWCDYFDKKMNFVKSRTSDLDSSQRPKVFWGRGPDPQTTHTKDSYPQWYVEIAGGDYVAKNVTGEVAQTIPIEQIIEWNPDLIFLGRNNDTGIVMNDSRWKNIKAVQNGNVYLSPAGVAWWDCCSEGVLFMEFLAKTIHPERFQDLDMIEEVKDYYSRFFHYDLTDEEANRILKHLPPAN
ncbi:MAG: ABC transporter substrate-binding protein [Methanothrix sp.]|nr:ABC transporter substrate-binding protein [Methanothrix sp.]